MDAAIKVRPATKEDTAALLALVDTMTPQDQVFTAFNAKKDVIKTQIRQVRHLHIAEIDGEIVGFGRESGRPGGAILLEEIVVAQNKRGVGVGRAIIQYLRAKFPSIQAKTHADNTPINKLMRSSGFAKVNESTKGTIYNWDTKLGG